MSGMNLVLLVVAMLEALVLYALLHYWRQKARACEACHGELAMARAALARSLLLVEIVGRYTQMHVQPEVQSAMSEVRKLRSLYVDGLYPEYHHTKRGTNYRLLLGEVRMNFAGRVRDGDEMVIYQDLETGKVSTRTRREFMDGRFQLVTGAETQSAAAQYPGSRGS